MTNFGRDKKYVTINMIADKTVAKREKGKR